MTMMMMMMMMMMVSLAACTHATLQGAPATAVAGSLMTGLGIFGVLDAPPAAHVHTQQKKTH
jgi:hypothetical protein